MMTRIALYSDFDGVLNVLRSHDDDLMTSQIVTRNSRFLARHHSISWNPRILTAFSQLLESGRYDFTWLTTWNDAGNISRAASIMGLADHVSHVEPRLNEGSQTRREWTRWKAEEIIRDQHESPRPYVWIDDDAPRYWSDHVQGHVLAPGLVIQPHSNVGLTADDIVSIIDFTVENTSWQIPETSSRLSEGPDRAEAQ